MSFTFSYLTNGLSALPNPAPLLTNGAPVSLLGTPRETTAEDLARLPLDNQRYNLTQSQAIGIQQAYLGSIKDPSGNIVVPVTGGVIPLGSGYNLSFDPTTTLGKVTPALSVVDANSVANLFGSVQETYTGADVRLMIEAAETPNDGRRYAKQLLEATTITVSTHREVAPVRSGGYINPKGFALGKRTIAGTIILTQFTIDVLLQFMQDIMMNDGSKDTMFSTVDQLPPFNITMIFGNESGYASCRRLLGVKFVTDGVVYSIQDMLSEQTLSWMATAFTPLVPLNATGLYTPVDATDPTTKSESTPTTTMREKVTHTISFGDTIIGGTQ